MLPVECSSYPTQGIYPLPSVRYTWILLQGNQSLLPNQPRVLNEVSQNGTSSSVHGTISNLSTRAHNVPTSTFPTPELIFEAHSQCEYQVYSGGRTRSVQASTVKPREYWYLSHKPSGSLGAPTVDPHVRLTVRCTCTEVQLLPASL